MIGIEKIKEILKECACVEDHARAIEKYEDYTGGEPAIGTCRNLGAIINAGRKAREALADLEADK